MYDFKVTLGKTYNFAEIVVTAESVNTDNGVLTFERDCAENGGTLIVACYAPGEWSRFAEQPIKA